MPNPQNEITQKDVEHIFLNPWKISAEEWVFDDVNIRKAMFKKVFQRLDQAREDGYYHIWRTPDEEPIAILGGFRKSERKYETFFIASNHMEEYAMKLSFDMRKILRDLAPAYKGFSCGLYSASDHPAQISWFKFLGFTYKPEGNVGNSKYFEFTSPAS